MAKSPKGVSTIGKKALKKENVERRFNDFIVDGQLRRQEQTTHDGVV